MQPDEVTRQAMALTLQERAELAQRLLLSLDEAPESEIEQLWIEEAERRLDEYRKGAVRAIPAGEVFARLVFSGRS
ncbi:MAG: addiction module protein [Armatimonadetes bacterium]|nr:addiction module protein [Armatimonadota bacterium]